MWLPPTLCPTGNGSPRSSRPRTSSTGSPNAAPIARMAPAGSSRRILVAQPQHPLRRRPHRQLRAQVADHPRAGGEQQHEGCRPAADLVVAAQETEAVGAADAPVVALHDPARVAHEVDDPGARVVLEQEQGPGRLLVGVEEVRLAGRTRDRRLERRHDRGRARPAAAGPSRGRGSPPACPRSCGRWRGRRGRGRTAATPGPTPRSARAPRSRTGRPRSAPRSCRPPPPSCPDRPRTSDGLPGSPRAPRMQSSPTLSAAAPPPIRMSRMVLPLWPRPMT